MVRGSRMLRACAFSLKAILSFGTCLASGSHDSHLVGKPLFCLCNRSAPFLSVPGVRVEYPMFSRNAVALSEYSCEHDVHHEHPRRHPESPFGEPALASVSHGLTT